MLTDADRAEIVELCHRYAVLVDARELTRVGALFAEDAEFVLPEPPRRLDGTTSVRGRAAIERALQGVQCQTATAHAVLALAIDELSPDGQPDADTATGLVTGQAHHLAAGPDGYVNTLWFLRYRDSYRRLDGRWRFGRRQLDITWIERHPVLLPRLEPETSVPSS